ncbi:hypothetical protein [Micromonospora sp. NPDC057141]|uniref:hypothetical protein n=1 Tax=Micromonospora sp. NPDC057141 TaxID=3346033 RepID=UPI003624ECFA
MESPPPFYYQNDYSETFYVRLKLRERATGDVITVTGSIDAICESIQDRELMEVLVSFSRSVSDTNQGELLLDRERGVSLKLMKSEEYWSSQVSSSVVSMLVERKPWWGNICTPGGRLVVARSSAVLIGLFLGLLFLPLKFAAAVPAVAGFWIAWRFLTPASVARIIPAFEVTESGSSRGQNVISVAIFGVLMALVLGVVVNRIS